MRMHINQLNSSWRKRCALIYWDLPMDLLIIMKYGRVLDDLSCYCALHTRVKHFKIELIYIIDNTNYFNFAKTDELERY